MKSISTLIALLLISASLMAQNNLFIPFGQTKTEVRRYLDSRDYISQIVEDNEMHSLRAKLDSKKHVEYVFKDGALYATSVSRNYDDKRIGKEIQKNVLEYMDYISRGAIQQNNSNGLMVYTAAIDSRVIKLFVQQHSASTTLTLTSISRDYMPEGGEQDFLYELELLQQSFISN